VLLVAQLRDVVLLNLRDRRREARPHFVHGHSEAVLRSVSRHTLRGARSLWWRTPIRRGGPDDMPGKRSLELHARGRERGRRWYHVMGYVLIWRGAVHGVAHVMIL